MPLVIFWQLISICGAFTLGYETLGETNKCTMFARVTVQEGRAVCLQITSYIYAATSEPAQIRGLWGSSVALAQSVLAELPDQLASFFNSYKLKPPNAVNVPESFK
ncbi:unnamed protein product [Menidia menidia]|uniref:(Atlantic silverside) hypothetical protein n=1 Tax=Menidia menidia TaxID=238744 RepID=A0A8S4AZE8_9TELE|nr:unnamed protein product [Menidia menidia]